MNSMIFNPLDEFNSKYQNLHFENTKKFFDELVRQSGIDIEANRDTVKKYNEYKDNLVVLRKKLKRFKVLRVFMCIIFIFVPLVIWKITPIIKELRSNIESADKTVEALMELAKEQMFPLNSLFTDRDALSIIETTIPLISFEPTFSAQQEMEMRVNYDMEEKPNNEVSTAGVLAGRYHENPFLFENKIVHTMGTATYRGSLTIYWTETYRDSDGRLRTVEKSQTLEASVTKPKPHYSTQVVLHYGAQGAPDLSFTRSASHLEKKSDKDINKMVKKGEKELKKMTDRAIKKNTEFMSMSNTGFEVMFNALDRTNEVQFRTLFTPLAQTNMVSLLRSKEHYGDDFTLIKRKRMNKVITGHSQNRVLKIRAASYMSYSYDVIHESFINLNTKFFKDVYFDFAPIWAIPVYQERPVHSLDPIPDFNRKYAFREYEVLANALDAASVVHPDSKTRAILKPAYVGTKNDADEICVSAYSYDIVPRVDLIPVYGGDGYYHDVPVDWDEYIPLRSDKNFFVTKTELAPIESILANKDGLCIQN